LRTANAVGINDLTQFIHPKDTTAAWQMTYDRVIVGNLFPDTASLLEATSDDLLLCPVFLPRRAGRPRQLRWKDCFEGGGKSPSRKVGPIRSHGDDDADAYNTYNAYDADDAADADSADIADGSTHTSKQKGTGNKRVCKKCGLQGHYQKTCSQGTQD
jgi:hypothetical protein